MKESSTYQAILREGRTESREEGKLQSLRDSLLDILQTRCGQLPTALVAEVSVSSDMAALKRAIPAAVLVGRLGEFHID